MDISSLNEHEILDLRLSDLAKLPTPTWITSAMKSLNLELKKKKISMGPHFWFGTEWFSPDGVPGIALPYYLLHPKLIKIEKKYTGHVEGITIDSFLKLARHELGHAIDNAYRLRKLKIRNKIFGPISKAYPTSYVPNPNSKEFVIHIEGHYAQAHPEEDWAETFAVWLNPKSNWKQKYAKWPAIEKLQYLNSVMENLQGTLAPNTTKKTRYNIASDHRTLRQYLKDKQVERKVNRADFFLTKIPKSYIKPNGRALSKIIRKNERYLKDILVNKHGLNTYTFKPMIALLKKETKKCFVSAKKDEQVIKTLSKIIKKEENRFKKQGRHRIIM